LLSTQFHTTYINRACHGAVAPNIFANHAWQTQTGSDDAWIDPWFEEHPWLNPGDVCEVDNTNDCEVLPYPEQQCEVYDDGWFVDECRHHLVAQMTFVNYETDIVLMTIGGNDLLFADAVTNCFALGFAESCHLILKKAKAKLTSGTFQKLIKSALDSLHARLRPSRGIVILPTYPDIVRFGSKRELTYKTVRQLGGGYTVTTTVTFDAAKLARELRDMLQTEQLAAVKAANLEHGTFVYFFDGSKKLFESHEPHPDLELKEADNNWIWDISFKQSWKDPRRDIFPRPLPEWYHPNQLGHQMWAEAIHKSFIEMIKDRFCRCQTYTGSRALLPTTDPPATCELPYEKSADVDLAIAIDTTGSMGGYIDQVVNDLNTIFDTLTSKTKSFRVGLVSYHDLPPEGAYGSKLELQFTDEIGLVRNKLETLSIYGGGDTAEAVFAGIQEALNMQWRPGVTKILLVIGDAPVKLPPVDNDGNLISAEQLIQKSKEIDPVQIFPIDMGYLNENGEMSSLALGTSGSVLTPGSNAVVDAVVEVILKAVDQPFAWIGETYVGKVGAPLTFDASGSYDPNGYILESYEWDFEGDGIYDMTTSVPSVSKTYTAPFSGLVSMRVTSAEGLSSIATANLLINIDGSVPQWTEEEAGDWDANDIPISSLRVLLFWLRQYVVSGSPSKLDKTMDIIDPAGANFLGGIANMRLEAAVLHGEKIQSEAKKSKGGKKNAFTTEVLTNIVAVTEKIMGLGDDVPLSSLNALMDMLRQDVVSGSPSNLDKMMVEVGQAENKLVAGVQRLHFEAQDYLNKLTTGSLKGSAKSPKGKGRTKAPTPTSFKRETLTGIVDYTSLIESAFGNANV